MKNNKETRVKFKEWECFLELGHYNTKNRLSISLVSAVQNDDVFLGEPIATATVNLPDISLNKDEIIIKTYSENEGLLEALQKSDLVSKTTRKIQTGFVECDVVKKTEKLIQLEKEAFSSHKMKK